MLYVLLLYTDSFSACNDVYTWTILLDVVYCLAPLFV